jgi:hypothetical protein
LIMYTSIISHSAHIALAEELYVGDAGCPEGDGGRGVLVCSLALFRSALALTLEPFTQCDKMVTRKIFAGLRHTLTTQKSANRLVAAARQIPITFKLIVWMNFPRGIMANPRIELMATRYPKVVYSLLMVCD